jgi:hypothetical protein
MLVVVSPIQTHLRSLPFSMVAEAKRQSGGQEQDGGGGVTPSMHSTISLLKAQTMLPSLGPIRPIACEHEHISHTKTKLRQLLSSEPA